MDFSTLVGLILSAAAAAAAVKGIPTGLADGQTLLIVFVGGIGAGFMAQPWRLAKQILLVVWKAFFSRETDVQELIQLNVDLDETARREGILALEARVDELDSFMACGIRLAVDGTEPELIQTIMETERAFVQERHIEGGSLLRAFGVGWAVCGGVAALGMLALAPEPGLAQVALPLLYGLILGGLFGIFLPWKLAARSIRECLLSQMIMEGVMSIQSGDNPRIVEQKLNVFIAPRDRVMSEEPAEPAMKPAEEALAADVEMQQKVKEGINLLSAALEGQEALPRRITFDELLDLAPEEGRASVLEAVGEEASYESPSVAPPLGGYDRHTDAFFSIRLDDISGFTDREIQMILREVDGRDLSLALLGLGDAVRDRIFSNVSDRVGGMIREQMTDMGPVKAREVLNVHLLLMHVIQKLRVTGEISV